MAFVNVCVVVVMCVVVIAIVIARVNVVVFAIAFMFAFGIVNVIVDLVLVVNVVVAWVAPLPICDAHVVDLPGDLPAATMKLVEEDRNTYWLTFKNFYVITRYNRSPRYAMAVYELSQEIKQGMESL